MTGSIEFTPGGNVVVMRDGEIRLDTSGELMNLLPTAAFNVTGYTFSWPTLTQLTYYLWNNHGFGQYSCDTYAAMMAQEYGPGRANNLPEATIGTVPAGIDYLDVFVNIARTLTPPGFIDLSIRTDMPQNQWVKLEGGSCLIEYMNGFRRSFEIVLDGTDVKVRRYQSVTANGPLSGIFPFSSSVASSLPPRSGLIGGSGPAIIGALKSSGGPSAQNHRPFGDGVTTQGSCSQNVLNYASTWVGDIRVVPGRITN